MLYLKQIVVSRVPLTTFFRFHFLSHKAHGCIVLNHFLNSQVPKRIYQKGRNRCIGPNLTKSYKYSPYLRLQIHTKLLLKVCCDGFSFSHLPLINQIKPLNVLSTLLSTTGEHVQWACLLKIYTYTFLSGFFPVTESFDFGLNAETSKYGECTCILPRGV